MLDPYYNMIQHGYGILWFHIEIWLAMDAHHGKISVSYRMLSDPLTTLATSAALSFVRVQSWSQLVKSEIQSWSQWEKTWKNIV